MLLKITTKVNEKKNIQISPYFRFLNHFGALVRGGGEKKGVSFLLALFIRLVMKQHSELIKLQIFVPTFVKIEEISNMKDLSKNVNKREIFQKLFSS